MSIILFLLFGLIVGAIARFIVPGSERGGWVISMILGVAGSLLGALVGRAIGVYDENQTTGGFFMSLLGAVILVGGYHAIARRRAAV
ncbi:MAG: GlsB/YeaQ/YmgE family stress response membrane protein [Polyangiales bacterium]